LSDNHSIYVEFVFAEKKNDTQHSLRNNHGHERRNPEAMEQVHIRAGLCPQDQDELVTKVQTKYAVDKVQAQKDVDAFARGRQL
jgi:hypothetical protein